MIKTLSITHFRGHDGTFHFGPGLNIIRGPNEGGKTTLAEAIKFVFTGSDIEDSTSTEHLISTGHDLTEVTLITAKAAITRKKKRNGTSQIKVAIGEAPPIEVSQTDLDERMLALDSQLFTSCWLSGYFMNSLSPEDRMRLLTTVSQVDRKELLLTLLPPGSQVPPKVKGEDTAVDLRVITDDRRALQNVLTSDQGALREIESAYQETLKSEVVTDDPAQVQTKVNELNAQLELHKNYQRDLSRYENSVKLREQFEATMSGSRTRLASTAERLKQLETQLKVSGPLPEVKDFTAKISELMGSKQPLPLAPQKPRLPEGEEKGSCPVCLQAISVEHRTAVINEYENSLMAYNKIASEASQHNLKVQSEIDSLTKQSKESREASDLFLRQRNQLELDVAQTSRHHSELKAEIEKQKEPAVMAAPTQPEGSAELIERGVVEQKALLDNLLSRAGKLQGLTQRKELLQETIQNRTQQIEWLTTVGRALEQLPIIEAEAMARNLRMEEGKLEVKRSQRKSAGKVLERGELVATDQVGTDYRALSSGRKIRFDSDLCYKFQELAGPRSPKLLFVDNKDLLDRPAKMLPGVQLLLCHVDASIGTGIAVDVMG